MSSAKQSRPSSESGKGKFQSFQLRDPDGWDLKIGNQTDTREL